MKLPWDTYAKWYRYMIDLPRKACESAVDDLHLLQPRGHHAAGRHLAYWSSAPPESSQGPTSSFERRHRGLKRRWGLFWVKEEVSTTAARHQALGQFRSDPRAPSTDGLGKEALRLTEILPFHALWFVVASAPSFKPLSVEGTCAESSTGLCLLWGLSPRAPGKLHQGQAEKDPLFYI